ncbi:phosphoenolpyruvate--protein phosphotransferase [Amycolatopsis sp. NBRC 101858]|uniref:phosphoenolpyruvate--protein phosphotransferase n=1 Tax=Amycolatopsis sp. NBRC 101858 TaxID=3032200 RepID=UPI0024A3CA92|nr:putative PEP-binding protein [Amycolatopsis sp. NBRC 101858]GLY36701.1 phosphoenolpyruvate--protein phosphotransferase [Amycolatopsis sp. NBRC 101858]
MQLSGVGVSPGRVAGPRVVVVADLREPDASAVSGDLEAEAGKIGPAAESVAAALSDRARSVSGDARSVLETTAVMAADPALVASAERLVRDRSLPAPRAVWEAAGEFMTALQAAGGYLTERAADVADVRDRIVAALSGLAPPGVPELTSPSVLVARDLAPADTAGLDPDLVLALVTEEGGPTSHTAILARALGIPAVVACSGVLGLAGPGLVVDGSAGTVSPSDGRVVAPARTARPVWDGVGRLADGHRVKLLANVGSASDARAAAAAEGIGLFRTEFCYLSATSEPTESAQRTAYAAVLAPFGGKPVVVRTLDAGSDKPLAFLEMGAEPNPALGVRGLRVAFDRPDVLDRQLSAIAAAAADTGVELSVMAPMVATAAEAAWFASRARAAGIARVGVMIEIPAAALCAADILAEVDFVSLGTNDLAQYVFAADRQLGAVAALNDPHQPALLRLVGMVAEAGAAAGKPVGVCGEAAADPALAPVLVGLGVTSLSMNAVALAGVGAALRAVDLAACRALA